VGAGHDVHRADQLESAVNGVQMQIMQRWNH